MAYLLVIGIFEAGPEQGDSVFVLVLRLWWHGGCSMGSVYDLRVGIKSCECYEANGRGKFSEVV